MQIPGLCCAEFTEADLTSYYAGASVIYADTVADLGYAGELGNYAEYSGAPNLQVTCHLAVMLQPCKASQIQKQTSDCNLKTETVIVTEQSGAA